MKKCALLLIISFFIHIAHCQQIENTTFQAGENFTYEMSYGFLLAGRAELELQEEIYENKNVYHCRGVGHTIGFADTLFNVLDLYESYFDKETCKPYRAICDIFIFAIHSIILQNTNDFIIRFISVNHSETAYWNSFYQYITV